MISVHTVPSALCDLCRDWYDGEKSVMGQIAFRTTGPEDARFNPRYLLSEVRKALHGLNMEKERLRLEQAERWCLQQIDRESATAAIRRAATRARNMGLTPHEFTEIALAHWRAV